MNRRDFLQVVPSRALTAASAAGALGAGRLFGAAGDPLVDAATAKDWLSR